MSRVKKSHAFAAAGLMALAGLAGMTATQTAQADDHAEAAMAETSMTIGLYDPQVAFQASPSYDSLMEKMEGIQTEFQTAQQSGDQAKMMELQQQVQQEQQTIVAQFEANVEKAIAEVAEEAGVKVIAMRVAYTAPDVDTTDLTEAVVEAIGGTMVEAPVVEMQPAAP